MTANDPQPGPIPRHSARLRLTGAIVLMVGMVAAAVVYWLGIHSPQPSNDLSMVGFNRAQRRQMGQLYGKMGTLIEDWAEDLKRPDNQAACILGVTAVVAFGCFFFARSSRSDDQANCN